MRVSYDKSNGLTNLEIMLGGDWELRTILTALKYMVNVLEKDIKEHEIDKKNKKSKNLILGQITSKISYI